MSLVKSVAQIKNMVKAKITHLLWSRELKIIDNLLKKELLSEHKNDTGVYKKEISYMRERGRIMFIPYKFTENYRSNDIKVYYDPKEKLKYVIHKSKRLYFPTENDTEIRGIYNQLLIEQDPESPHRYFSKGFEFEEGMIFVDVGAAEGIISLEVVDLAKEIYLFECGENWIQALEATFRPWKEKVHIIAKYAGKQVHKNTTTLDSVLGHYKNEEFFIKMDVEGMEQEVLEGAEYLLRNKNVKCVCTTYHQEQAARNLKNYFKNRNYIYEFSKNYILFCYGYGVFLNKKYRRIRSPYFRKGLIRAKNDC